MKNNFLKPRELVALTKDLRAKTGQPKAPNYNWFPPVSCTLGKEWSLLILTPASIPIKNRTFVVNPPAKD